MSEEERNAEFEKLFDSLPGNNCARVKSISDFLCCKRNTVRIWRMKETSRSIPEAKLRQLQRHFAAETTAEA